MQFDIVEQKEFDQLPKKVPAQANKDKMWEPVMQTLEKGKVAKLTVSSPDEIRGLKIAAGRRAKSRGMILDIREEGLSVYLKKSGDAPE